MHTIYVWMFKLIIALHLLLLPIYLYLTWNFNYWKKRGIRTARPITMFGTFPSIITRMRNIAFDIHEVYLKYSTKCRLIGVFLTRQPAILILDPMLAHDILTTEFEDFRDNLMSDFMDGEENAYACRNPRYCTGMLWKKRRFDIAAGLTPAQLVNSFAIWDNTCKNLTAFINGSIVSGTSTIETKDLTRRYAAEVMCNFIWGLDAETLSYPLVDTKIMQIMDRLTTQAYAKQSNCFLATLAPGFLHFFKKRIYVKETEEFFARMTKEAIKIRSTMPELMRPDYLDYLLYLSKHKGATKDDIIGYSLTLLLYGYDITSNVLMHTLYYLSKYPVTQDKLRKEILEHRKKFTDGFSFESLNLLTYLDQCVNETLRIISMVPHITRVCVNPTRLEFIDGKFTDVAVGTKIILPIYSFHHDESVYESPYSYMPDRFNNNASRDFIERGYFVPFGDGPRTCVGSVLSMLTVKVGLMEILTNFEIGNYGRKVSFDIPTSKTFLMSIDGDIKLYYRELSKTNASQQF